MYIEQKYVGVCSKCNSDVFIDIYEQKLDLIQSCECINNQIIPCKWWETYVFYPVTWKVITLPILLILFSDKLIAVITIISTLLFAKWAWDRKFRIQNKVDTEVLTNAQAHDRIYPPEK